MGNNKPVFRVDVGCVTASVWKTDLSEGSDQKIESVSLDKRYKDKSGEWKSTTSFRESDLPKAILALQKVYEHFHVKSVEREESRSSFSSAIIST